MNSESYFHLNFIWPELGYFFAFLCFFTSGNHRLFLHFKSFLNLSWCKLCDQDHSAHEELQILTGSGTKKLGNYFLNQSIYMCNRTALLGEKFTSEIVQFIQQNLKSYLNISYLNKTCTQNYIRLVWLQKTAPASFNTKHYANAIFVGGKFLPMLLTKVHQTYITYPTSTHPFSRP